MEEEPPKLPGEDTDPDHSVEISSLNAGEKTTRRSAYG